MGEIKVQVRFLDILHNHFRGVRGQGHYYKYMSGENKMGLQIFDKRSIGKNSERVKSNYCLVQ